MKNKSKNKIKILSLKVVYDTTDRSVKLMQDFQRVISTEEEQIQLLLRYVQHHRKLYPNCKTDSINENIYCSLVILYLITKKSISCIKKLLKIDKLQ